MLEHPLFTPLIVLHGPHLPPRGAYRGASDGAASNKSNTAGHGKVKVECLPSFVIGFQIVTAIQPERLGGQSWGRKETFGASTRTESCRKLCGRRSPTKKKGPRCQLIRPTPKKVERHHLRLVFSIGRRIRCVEPTHSKRVENRMGAMADKPWRPCFLLYLLLEVDLRAKLQSTSIVGRGHLSKVSIGEAVIDVLELSVVEGIKGLKTQLKIRSLAGGEWDCLE